jgi:ubiquinol-cytochrome c reductase cytochrome b subunit
VSFHPFFSLKDYLGGVVAGLAIFILATQAPWLLGDPENFIPANPLVTPVHIQPEWYFLFAYAILRSIPNKLGGVVALVGSILILTILPFYPSRKFSSVRFYPIAKFWVIALFTTVVGLTWIGARLVEHPYVAVGQLLSLAYFLSFIGIPIATYFEEKALRA